MRNIAYIFGVLAICIFMSLATSNCGTNMYTGAVSPLPGGGGGGGDGGGSGTGTGTGTGTGGGAGGAMKFVPESASGQPGETINFSIVNGTPNYQVGFESAADLTSYGSINEVQAQYNQTTGSGWYKVGPYGPGVDRLCALDSKSQRAYLTVYAVGGTTPTTTGTSPTTTGTIPKG